VLEREDDGASHRDGRDDAAGQEPTENPDGPIRFEGNHVDREQQRPEHRPYGEDEDLEQHQSDGPSAALSRLLRSSPELPSEAASSVATERHAAGELLPLSRHGGRRRRGRGRGAA
jgi:hypothetical protein